MSKIQVSNQQPYGLEGRIVTLDEQSTVMEDGVVYIQGDTIVAVQPRTQAAPPGFSKKDIIKTGGTIYPGMIELHNHLSYNIVPMWNVPKKFDNRDQWRRHPDYRKSMTGPLKVLGHIDGYLQAIVRYVECRLLFSGVTASQGITLASHSNIRKMYRGVVRNVEQPIDPELPRAHTKIADIKDAAKLAELLEKISDRKASYILHLAEGTQASANKHFKALQVNTGEWAINDHFAGIHACGLREEDFKVLGDHNGNMVWSPLSNLLLYGVTADIEAAKANDILMSIGSDWTPSGSKNLLCELKVAKLISADKGDIFTDEELVRMVTTNAAKILKWYDHLGTIEAGKKADLLVLTGKKDADVYQKFVQAKEQTISFTLVDGLPRCGQKRLMSKFEVELEEVKMGSSKRYLNLFNDDPQKILDLELGYKEAKTKLKDGLANLPQHAIDLENTSTSIFAGALSAQGTGNRWTIESDHEDCGEYNLRHHIPYDGEESTGAVLDLDSAASKPLSEILEPIVLDEATILDDKLFFKRLALNRNLPNYLKLQLPVFYGQKISLSDTSDYVQDIAQAADNAFDYIMTLRQFNQDPGHLTLDEKEDIIEQAKLVLENAYVHLRQKTALYASNPVAHLDVLLDELQNDPASVSEQEFHRRMINIFNSVRDLHTTYSLPPHYQGVVAFLPFFIEEYFVDGQAHYTVSKLIGQKNYGKFVKGVEITHWNGIPIHTAIRINGQRFAGSNDIAQFSRGLDSLTFRPLSMMLAPEEEWVNISYLQEGKKYHRKFNWLVGRAAVIKAMAQGMDSMASSYQLGYDNQTHLVQQIKKNFFAKPQLQVTDRGTLEGLDYPSNFRVDTLRFANREVGYIRIFSFDTGDPFQFANAFKDILSSFNTDDIIIDIRNNPGGHIWAAEFVLQCLSTKRISPAPAQFLNSELNEWICRQHAPSATVQDFDLTPWHRTFNEIRRTGANFSLPYPITPVAELTQFKASQKYNLVLITDALCYSASDIFAAGFRDHKLGSILGTQANIGAGGANVWSHSLLHFLTSNANGQSQFFQSLSKSGADFRVAIRRTLRVKDNQGMPLEDLGVKPDQIHQLSKNDLLNSNEDLLEVASNILAAQALVKV